jgi:hypothetical protein
MKFVLGRSFDNERANGLVREKIELVETRYGKVLAYENRSDGNPDIETVCPGLYEKELDPESCITEAEIFLASLGRPPPPDKLYRAMNLKTVPEEYRPGVTEDLKKEGYACTKIFW